MKFRRTPQEKKRLSYTRDHLNIPYNSDKGSRKSWPRKEARAARAERRKVAQTLHSPAPDSPQDLDTAVRSIARKEVRKSGAIPLAMAVARDIQARAERHGRHKAVHNARERIRVPTAPSKV